MQITRRDVLAATAAAALPRAAMAQTPPELSFLVLGDWGRRGRPEQKAVAGQMADTARRIGSQFVVTVGDNFYNTGVSGDADSHWKASYGDVYDLGVLNRWHPALGNHDHDGRPEAQVAYRGHPAWQMAGAYYEKSVDLPDGKRLGLFVLDTSPLADAAYARGHEAEVAAQKAWLDERLRASTADWKLVFGHHPIATSGTRGRVYREFAAWLSPQLRDRGVQAYVAGHEHHLEHLRNRDGVTYIVSGAGSENDGMRARKTDGHIAGWGSGYPGFTAFRFAADQLVVEFMSPRQAEPVGRALVTRDRVYPAALRAA